jgi:hypothetical protein
LVSTIYFRYLARPRTPGAPVTAAFKAGSALLYAGLRRAEQAIPR